MPTAVISASAAPAARFTRGEPSAISSRSNAVPSAPHRSMASFTSTFALKSSIVAGSSSPNRGTAMQTAVWSSACSGSPARMASHSPASI
jgi:hypothetical protein